MSTYVDNLYESKLGSYRRMRMSHLIADTRDELIAMVKAIDVQTRWIQHPGQCDEHFDIAMSKRTTAIARGAIAIDMRECSAMVFRRKITGELGKPEEAIEWRRAYRLAMAKDPPQPRDGEQSEAVA